MSQLFLFLLAWSRILRKGDTPVPKLIIAIFIFLLKSSSSENYPFLKILALLQLRSSFYSIDKHRSWEQRPFTTRLLETLYLSRLISKPIVHPSPVWSEILAIEYFLDIICPKRWIKQETGIRKLKSEITSLTFRLNFFM